MSLALRRIDHIFTFFHKLSTRCLYVSLLKGNKREKDLEVLCVENWHWWSQRQKYWGIFPQKLIIWGLSISNRIYLNSHMLVTLRCLLWEGNSQVGYMVSICVCVVHFLLSTKIIQSFLVFHLLFAWGQEVIRYSFITSKLIRLI